jgi:hypothetical protein
MSCSGLDHETIVMGMSALVGGSFDAIVDWLLLHVSRICFLLVFVFVLLY